MRMSYLQCVRRNASAPEIRFGQIDDFVGPIVAPPAESSGCASSADCARLAAARISVQMLLRIRISMSGGTSVISLKFALKALLDTSPR